MTVGFDDGGVACCGGAVVEARGGVLIPVGCQTVRQGTVVNATLPALKVQPGRPTMNAGAEEKI